MTEISCNVRGCHTSFFSYLEFQNELILSCRKKKLCLSYYIFSFPDFYLLQKCPPKFVLITCCIYASFSLSSESSRLFTKFLWPSHESFLSTLSHFLFHYFQCTTYLSVSLCPSLMTFRLFSLKFLRHYIFTLPFAFHK